MPSLIDNLGTWLEVGTISPSFDEWSTFSEPMISARTIRLIFSSPDWTKRGYTFAWFRHIFYNDDVSWATRIYPKLNRVIIDLPIPEEFIAMGNVVTHLQIRKDGKFKVNQNHVPWTVNAWYKA